MHFWKSTIVLSCTRRHENKLKIIITHCFKWHFPDIWLVRCLPKFVLICSKRIFRHPFTTKHNWFKSQNLTFHLASPRLVTFTVTFSSVSDPWPDQSISETVFIIQNLVPSFKVYLILELQWRQGVTLF